MNTANLQVEGLLLAVSELIDVLVDKGLLGEGEVIDALRRAEARARGDEARTGQLSASNCEAVTFPIRYLIEDREKAMPRPFSRVAADVGRRKTG